MVLKGPKGQNIAEVSQNLAGVDLGAWRVSQTHGPLRGFQKVSRSSQLVPADPSSIGPGIGTCRWGALCEEISALEHEAKTGCSSWATKGSGIMRPDGSQVITVPALPSSWQEVRPNSSCLTRLLRAQEIPPKKAAKPADPAKQQEKDPRKRKPAAASSGAQGMGNPGPGHRLEGFTDQGVCFLASADLVDNAQATKPTMSSSQVQ